MARIWRTWQEKRNARDNAVQEAARRAQLLVDYRQVFGGEAGQRVLADILQRCGIAQSTFAAGVPDQTAFNEGRRRVGLEIIETLNRDPDAARALLQTGETEGLFDERDK